MIVEEEKMVRITLYAELVVYHCQKCYELDPRMPEYKWHAEECKRLGDLAEAETQ